MPRRDPSLRYQFIVKVDGRPAGEFTKVAGLVGFELKTGSTPQFENGLFQIPQVEGVASGTLKLTRGLCADGGTLWSWIQGVASDPLKPTQKTVTVQITDQKGQKVREWTFRGAYPTKWSVSELQQSAEILEETFELAYQTSEFS